MSLVKTPWYQLDKRLGAQYSQSAGGNQHYPISSTSIQYYLPDPFVFKHLKIMFIPQGNYTKKKKENWLKRYVPQIKIKIP
jgi:hypothetical protein